MKKSRFTEQQIVGILKEGDAGVRAAKAAGCKLARGLDKYVGKPAPVVPRRFGGW